MIIIILILAIILFILSLIHFNWARGGIWGFENALPTNEKGERILNPRKIDSLIVGLGLLGFAFFYLHLSSLLTLAIFELIMHYLKWIIPSIFMLRAIGDFRYVGLFKKVKNTKFGRFDTYYFTPLCIIIVMLGLLIAY
ncbi:MAG: hypothetical protein ACJA1A_002355 [Saprospiraceae bacterium]|jgi:hypothetical protein|tara:strand:+ start:1407 stop:1823 length:417 start_codon:yes stop_codon:yes gene_type:complete